MPFTPFHMGAAVLLKPLAPTRFSVLVFGVSQVAIDLEPLVRILRRDEVLHGWTHTLLGALALGAVAAGVAHAPVNWWIALLRRREAPATFTAPLGWRVAFASAWIGTGTHLLFDGIMHADMMPFAPLTAANPLLGAIGMGSLHLGLLAAGLLGLILLALRSPSRHP